LLLLCRKCAHCRRSWSALEALLIEANMEAGQLVNEASLLHVAFGEQIDELERQIADFDYESALVTLRAAATGLAEELALAQQEIK